MKRGEIAYRGDDGVDREAGLQDGQNPAQHLKTDHTYARDDLPSHEHPNQVQKHHEKQYSDDDRGRFQIVIS